MSEIKYTELSKNELLYLKAKHAYYTLAEPIMSDADFDVLEMKLTNEDSFVVGIVGDLKPTKTGFKVSKSKTKTVQHDSKMGSLDKVKFQKDYTPYSEFKLSFLDKYHKDCDIEVTPKFDGNAISIKYVDGNLIHIASRGDGVEGQDYTNLGLNVPQKLPHNFTGEIRGEAVIDITLFEQKYGEKSDLEKPFANARNFVAGTLNKGEKSRINDIDIVAFGIADYEDNDTLVLLRKYGFLTPTYIKKIKKSELTQKGFEKLYTEFDVYRQTSRYQLDGFVLKYPEELRHDIGGNDHHPFWAIAVKFVPEEVTTTIIDIDWTLGKRGQLSPVAVLEPINLMGSVVQRASLYNASWMLENKCLIGAEVVLVKSGDIIPTIIDIVKESTVDYDLPTEFAGEPTKFDGVELMLENFENTDMYKEKMMYHTISALGIKNVGPALSARIYQSGVSLVDMFSMTPQQLKQRFILSGVFTDGRELEKMIDAFFSLTKIDYWKIIYSFGHINLGKTISKELAKYILGMKYDFTGLERKVVENFINDQNKIDAVKELVTIMENANIEVIRPTEPNANAIKICMTGSPKPFGFGTKGLFLSSLENFGVIEHKLNKDCHYLITDSLVSQTSKMKTAEKLGVKIMTYEQFSNKFNK